MNCSLAEVLGFIVLPIVIVLALAISFYLSRREAIERRSWPRWR